MLELRHIVYKYEEQPLLRDISFSVQQDETVCLLGPSGGGKTTILRIIAGLENPASGIVCWNGADISKLPAHNREFGLMFQDYALFPHLNVYENVAFGLRMKEKSDQEVADRVGESLEITSLEHLSSIRQKASEHLTALRWRKAACRLRSRDCAGSKIIDAR